MKKCLLGLTILLIILNLTGCKETKVTQSTVIDHVVFLWLQDSTDIAILDSIKLHSQNLDTIPGIISLSMGEALASDRPIVDDSFSLGLIFQFRSADEMKTYTAHPDHVEFIKRWVKPHSKKILIYDMKR